MKPSPEFTLAIDCCRAGFHCANGEPAPVPAELDWTRFVQLVEFHRVQGLAWAALANAEVPEEVASRLSTDGREIAAANLRAAVECRRLAAIFSKHGVDVLFFKGLTVSMIAYGDPYIKMNADIDILVAPETVEDAAKTLGEAGFRCFIPEWRSLGDLVSWHLHNKESAWINRDTDHVVELHTHLVDNRRLIPGIGLASPRQTVKIGGGLNLSTFATDDLVAYLFVHGGTSGWYRLKWIADVAAILDRVGPCEAERLYRHARSLKAGRTPAQALLLAHRLFGISLPDDLLTELRRDRTSELLADLAYRELLKSREPTGRRGGTAVFRMTRPFLSEGWGFALNDVGNQAKNIFRRHFRIP